MIAGLVAGALLGAVALFITWPRPEKVKAPVARSLLQYTFDSLRQRKFAPTEILYEKKVASEVKFSTWIFHYYSDGKKISGLANLPTGVSTQSAITAPTILMLHGSADSAAEYFPGFGTAPVAEVLARNGFATFAPDFLGYGTSDAASPDPFEDRFQTYTTTLTLLETLRQSVKVGIWGHSNGGQIALSDLEISGAKIPTVLWNPVSESFPYNILYYTNGYDDHGKWLRSELAKFETLYDVENYSTPNFLSWINAPILLQQGEADEWVPKAWSDKLYKELNDIRVSSPSTSLRAEYKVYSGADHNMKPDWNQAASDSLNFFKKYLPL